MCKVKHKKSVWKAQDEATKSGRCKRRPEDAAQKKRCKSPEMLIKSRKEGEEDKNLDLSCWLMKGPRASETQIFAFRCFLAIITIVIYMNSLNCGFVYDDRRAILENRNVALGGYEDSNVFAGREELCWLQLFKDDFWGTPLSNSGSHKSYRPLVTLTFKLQARVHLYLSRLLTTVNAQNKSDNNSAAFGYHLVNLLLHLCVVDLVFQVGSAFLLVILAAKQSKAPGEDDWAHRCSFQLACTSSLLFACHPIHVEAVSSLVGRAELMGALFGLLSFWALLEQLVEAQRAEIMAKSFVVGLAKSSGWAVCACLSKENSGLSMILINLLLIAWLKLKSPRTARKLALACSAMLSVLVAYIALRIQLNSSGRDEDKLSFGSSNQFMPNFSRADNPLAQSARQFCLRQAAQVKDTFRSSNFNLSNDNICSNNQVLNKVNQWQLATRFYLAAFNLKLMVNPTELSYDWSLEAIGLVKSALEFRFVVAVCLYFALVLFLLIWARKLITGYLSDTSFGISVRPHPAADCRLQSKCKQLEAASSSSGDESETSVDTVRSSDSGFVDSTRAKFDDKTRRKIVSPRLEPPDEQEDELDALGWSLIFLVVPYLPASNLFLTVGFLVAERTLYLPSFGFCMLASLLVGKVAAKVSTEKRIVMREEAKLKKIMIGAKFKTIWPPSYVTANLKLIFPLLILGSLKTVRRNADWRDESSLFASNLVQSPVKSMANLASLKSNVLTTEQAEVLYEKALQLEPTSADLHYNL